MEELTPEQIAMDKWLIEGTPLAADEPVAQSNVARARQHRLSPRHSKAINFTP
jgi:hypothetical protein